MQGISVGTIGQLEVVQGTGHDAGRVELRTWDGVPNSKDASIAQSITLQTEQAAAYLAMLRLAVQE